MEFVKFFQRTLKKNEGGVITVQLLKSEYYELPSRYNQTIIRLLVQSPTRMYVYWEVSDDIIKEFSKKHINYANCVPALRVTNVSKNYSYMIPVDPYANNYYIDVEDSGCKYIVELGRYCRNEYISIYASNEAIVPLGHPAYSDYNNISAGILFGNYLCISDQKRIKIYGQREHYEHFKNQNSSVFDGKRVPGSSELLLRRLFRDISSEVLIYFLGSSENSVK